MKQREDDKILEKVRRVTFSKIEWIVNSTFHFVFARRQISNSRQLLRGLKNNYFINKSALFMALVHFLQTCFAFMLGRQLKIRQC